MSEDTELPEFIARSIRGPRSSVYHQLLSQKLIQVNRSHDLLKKIALIGEAAYICRNKDDIDMDIIEVAAHVCQSFQNTNLKTKHGWAPIAWSFKTTEENYERFIKSWNLKGFGYWALETSTAHDMFPKIHRLFGTDVPVDQYDEVMDTIDDARTKVEKAINEKPEHQRFFTKSQAIGLVGFQSILGEFVNWMLPKLLEIEGIIMDEIDPKQYRDTFSLMVGQIKDSDEI